MAIYIEPKMENKSKKRLALSTAGVVGDVPPLPLPPRLFSSWSPPPPAHRADAAAAASAAVGESEEEEEAPSFFGWMYQRCAPPHQPFVFFGHICDVAKVAIIHNEV